MNYVLETPKVVWHGLIHLAFRWMALFATLTLAGYAGAQSCPIESTAIEDAKPNKLYLYFPTADDATFPAYATNVSPLRAFDTANLTDYTGTVSDLRDQVTNVAIDDYCEFNVKVLETTTTPPTTFPRRVTVGIGTDSVGTAATGVTFGLAQEVDTGDAIVVDFARVWAGSYETLAGAGGDGRLSGANSTLQRWAFSIGGTASHEAGHTYGLAHNDDFLQTGPDPTAPGWCTTGTDETKAGEDALTRHVMAAGCHFTSEQRAGFRRHFSDATYSILASNVGLSVETIHNWDFTNPNAASASQLQFELLSSSGSLTPSWTYLGNLSPWTTPTVTSIGTTPFKGATLNRYRVTFSNGQAWANGPSGVVPGGATFHVGAAFSEADFTVPDSVIVVKIALLDGGGTALTLQPRMVAYDTGALDASDGTYQVRFFNADDPARALIIRNFQVTELPKVASIDSMVRGVAPQTRDGQRIPFWKSERKLCDSKNRLTNQASTANQASTEDCPISLTDATESVTVAKLSQGRHIVQVNDGKCPIERGNSAADTSKPPEVNNCPTAGVNLDLFPATTLYITATVVDPNAKHWDPVQKIYVTGPLESHLFYQIAGRHPDLNRNGIDDYIDILKGKSKDTNGDGVPDEVQHCLKQLHELDSCEAREAGDGRRLADIERHEIGLTQCEQRCEGKPGEEACERQCGERREKLDAQEHELDESLGHERHECRESLRDFKHCEEEFLESNKKVALPPGNSTAAAR
jgi:hypothetical protein